MSALLIWMNSHEAKIFHLMPNTIHLETVKFHGPRHSDETLGKNHPKNQTDEEVFFRQLIAALEKSSASKWLLMGPSMGPKHFYQFLKTHHLLQSRKVIGVEKVDQMPDSEILSVGRSYLHHYYMFQGAN
jgi:hypothetical protein